MPRKAAAPKKAVAKKKVATPKKATASKKAAPKKAAAPKKKAVTKQALTRKAAPKKSAAPKKAAASKKTAPKKAAAPKQAATPKKAAPGRSRAQKTSTSPSSVATLFGIDPYTEKRGEEYMNEKQQGHFKLLLKAWKQQLMEEVDRTVSHMKDEAANFPDPADRATQEEEFSLELRTRDRERKLIRKIDSTIERIENDDYGFCDQCGVEIGVRRLEARPTASLCVDCKTLDEIKERQITGG